MLLNAILETHAWASTRPKHESSLAALNIEQKIVSVMETEKEQGMFISHPRSSSSLYAGIVGRHLLPFTILLIHPVILFCYFDVPTRLLC